MDDPLNLMRVIPTQGVSEPDWPLSRATSAHGFIFKPRITRIKTDKDQRTVTNSSKVNPSHP